MVILTESNVLYGWYNNIKNKRALNVPPLIQKFHIFSTSSCDDNLCFEGLLLRLQDQHGILKQGYTTQRKLLEHLEKIIIDFTPLGPGFFSLYLIVTFFFKPAAVMFVVSLNAY